VRVISCVMMSLSVVLGLPAVYCQSSMELPLNQNVETARALLQQVVVAMGGQSFQDLRDSDCNGQIADFGHNGDIVIFAPYREMWLLPDKRRTEYSSNGHILVTIFNGEEGWALDETGLYRESDDAIRSFADVLRFGMFSALRSVGNEGRIEFRYVGRDSIDGKTVEWIESSDRNNPKRRLAIEASTHLPLEWVVSSKDPDTDDIIENTTTYAQFTLSGGVQTPLNISYLQNRRLISQRLIRTCKYNSNLSPELFTRSSLEQCQKEIVKKGSKQHSCSRQ
jgi:hypothetical protein